MPTYGYRKVQAEKQKDWLIEVPQNVDPNTDMFAEKAKTKKENVAKNEYQRLRNIAAARKIKVPQVGLPPMEANLHVPQVSYIINLKLMIIDLKLLINNGRKVLHPFLDDFYFWYCWTE